MNRFILILLLFILSHHIFAGSKRVNTNLLATMVAQPNIEYDHQFLDNWFLSASMYYRLNSSPFLVNTTTKLSFLSTAFMIKRYFDFEITGFYLGVGVSYTLYRLYEPNSLGEDIVYKGGSMNDFSWIYDIGFTDMITGKVFYTAYIGATEHYSDFNQEDARVDISFSPHLGLCLGYQF